jgi:TRAP-type mannitol/chloroaromatic compound transport system permease large subunit
MLLSITVGLITPPFGLLLFIMKGVMPQGTRMSDVYLSASPFIILTFIGIALILIFPGIAVWLPAHM